MSRRSRRASAIDCRLIGEGLHLTSTIQLSRHRCLAIHPLSLREFRMNGSHRLCMDYTTLALPPRTTTRENQNEFAAVHSLYETLRRLPDSRRRQGKRYELAL